MFSLDDLAGHFWSQSPAADDDGSSSSSSASKNKSTPPPIMNRSMSEWQFQCFLQHASPPPQSPSNPNEVNDQNQSVATTNTCGAAAYGPPSVPIDSEEYQTYLKSKLNLACAAVALTRENGSHTASKGNRDGPVGIPSLPVIQNNTAISVKSATSGSSRELSDDDELDGDTETNQNADPSDVRRVRRMISNRESARRSRRRKQDHLTELETQASQSRVENSTLLKRLSDINQKYTEAAVDNRVLKADVETMRAKVKMAEESVKRITGFNPMVQPMGPMPSYYCIPSDASTDNMNQQQFHQGQLSSTTTNQRITPVTQHTMLNLPPVENVQPPNIVMPEAGAQKMGRTATMQYVASLEHLQKQFCGDVGSSCGTTQRGGDRK